MDFLTTCTVLLIGTDSSLLSMGVYSLVTIASGSFPKVGERTTVGLCINKHCTYMFIFTVNYTGMVLCTVYRVSSVQQLWSVCT